MTKYSATEKNVDNLCNVLCECGCVAAWYLTPALYSLYRNGYLEYCPTYEQLMAIQSFVMSKSLGFPVYYNKMTENPTYTSVEDFVHNNQVCYANTYALSILPDGKATVCEMLYGNEHFILGDITTSTIAEIWNSSRAKELYSAKHHAVCRKDNPCSICSLYFVQVCTR